MGDERERELEREAAAGDREAARALELERERRGEASLAVLADVHANLAALDAVLDDVAARGIGEVICLGGLTLYGPEPAAVIDRLREREVPCLLGSYDAAVQGQGVLEQRSGSRTRTLCAWVRAQLKPGCWARRATRERWGWYCSLPERRDYPGLIAVHGRPETPLYHHLPNSVRVDRSYFQPIERLALGGVLGYGCVTSEAGEHLRGSALEPRYELPAGGKLGICPGSVGQPRDGDARASFATIDFAPDGGHVFTVHRVMYDVSAARRETKAAGLPPILGERLAIGA